MDAKVVAVVRLEGGLVVQVRIGEGLEVAEKSRASEQLPYATSNNLLEACEE